MMWRPRGQVQATRVHWSRAIEEDSVSRSSSDGADAADRVWRGDHAGGSRGYSRAGHGSAGGGGHPCCYGHGTAPATRGSGKHTRHVENRWCNRRLKNAFDQLALTAREREPLSREYYERCLNRGLDKQEAHKRLMRRLSDIIFAMMRDRTPYDPEIHRRKQAERGKKKGESVAAAGQRQEPFAFPPPRDVTISRVRKRVKQRGHALVPV